MATATLCAVSRNIVDERCLGLFRSQELPPTFITLVHNEQRMADSFGRGGNSLEPLPLVAAAVGTMSWIVEVDELERYGF